MNDRPVVDCAYGYQRENEEEQTAGKKVAPMRKAVKKIGAKKMAGDKTVASVEKQVRRESLSVDMDRRAPA